MTRVDERERGGVHAVDRSGEERLDDHVLKHAGRAGGRVRADHARSDAVAPAAVDLNRPVPHFNRDGRRSFDDRGLGRRRTAVARTVEDTRLEDEIAVGVRQVAQKFPRDDRFDRLVVHGRGDGDRTCRAGRNDDGIPIERHGGAVVRQRSQPRIAQERVVVDIAVAVQIAELRKAVRVVPVDDDVLRVDRQAAGIGHQIERRRVDEIERRAAVAETGDGLELVRIGIRRSGGDLPAATREIGIDHCFAREAADAARRALPEGIVDVEPAAGRQIRRPHREPRGAPLRKSCREVVTAAAVGDRHADGHAAVGRRMRRTRDRQIENVAQPIPCEPCLLRHGAAAFAVNPVRVRIDALLVRRRETERRQLGIRLDVASLVGIAADHARDVGVAADEVMREVGSRRRAGGRAIDHGGTRRVVAIQRVGRARLPVVLLHVARLAVALERRIEVAVAGPIRVPAARPLRVRAFDRKAADPSADAVLDRQRVGDVVARAAEFGPRREHLTEA